MLSTRPICASGLETHTVVTDRTPDLYLAAKHLCNTGICTAWDNLGIENRNADIAAVSMPGKASSPFSAEIYGQSGVNGNGVSLPGQQAG